jgi:hypothetical protein
MFQMTVKQIETAAIRDVDVNGIGALGRFYRAKKTSAASYATRKDGAACDEALTSLRKERSLLFSMFGNRVETKDGSMVEIPNENVEKFSMEMSGLLDATVDVPGQKISVSSIADNQLSSSDMEVLEPFLKDG